MRLRRYLVTVLVPLLLLESFATSSSVSANYSCFATTCGETWRNNFSTNCYGISGWQCYQGTWSATYVIGGTAKRLVIEENAERYVYDGYYLEWQYKWQPRVYVSSDVVYGWSTAGYNFDSQVNHRTWAYHYALDGYSGGWTSDGY
jgi:hypothetical protein